MPRKNGPHAIKVRGGWRFRIYKPYIGEKPGLYFDRYNGAAKFKIGPTEAIKIRDWLSRYIAKHINKLNQVHTVESRAHARAIIRHQEKLETK